ncbi:MAG: methyltransferase domain-containing protein [Desulfobacteraceae bacterium]|nr:methyltransferase domain-containing protein [Desulfobacteraceae bacterium]
MTDERTKYVLSKLACPSCSGGFSKQNETLFCKSCKTAFEIRNGIFFFGATPADIVPSPAKYDPRDPSHWTPWRKANFQFLESCIASVPRNSELLDLGAGYQSFATLTDSYQRIAADFYPYPGIDLCFDFTKAFPIRSESFDWVLLSNVLEHVYEPGFLLSNINRVLRPEGLLIVMVPFLTGIHQAPYDFVRYTEFGLRKILSAHQFHISDFQAYGNPIYSAHRYLDAAQTIYRGHWAYGLRPLHRFNWILIRLMKKGVMACEYWVKWTTGIDRNNPDFIANIPVGYMVTARKVD